MKKSQISSHAARDAASAPDTVNHVLASPGRPLEPVLRQDMEQRFGHDFSRVRVHADSAAGRSARDVNANAYTVGQNNTFGEGRFAPETSDGRRLPAHEPKFTQDFTRIPVHREFTSKRHAKLTVNTPGDTYEQEADRVAEQVLTKPQESNGRAAAQFRIQRHSMHAARDAVSAPDTVNQVLARTGRPLEPALRQDMEQRFGHDFSRVRVHTDSAAGRSARDVNANAYTVGQNIAFGEGRFAPETSDGRRLLAHELAHVVQQSANPMLTHQAGDSEASAEKIVQRDTPAYSSGAQLPSPSYVNNTQGSPIVGGGVLSAADSKFAGGETTQLFTAAAKILGGLSKFNDVAVSIQKIQGDDKAGVTDSAANISNAILGFTRGMEKLAIGINSLASQSENNAEALKQYSNANMYATRIVKAANTIASAVEATAAQQNLRKDPSPANAKAWADSVTGLFTSAGGLLDGLPDGCIPGFIKDYYKGLFSAPASYVGAFETLIELHYGLVDKTTGLDHGRLYGINRHDFATQGEKTKWEGKLFGIYLRAFTLPKSKDGLSFEEFMESHRTKEGPDLYDVNLATGKALLLVAVQRDAPEEVKGAWSQYLGGF